MTHPDDAAILACLSHPIAYHRIMARIAGGATAGLFLSQTWYWHDKGSDPNGWIYKTQADWEDETGLTRREQESARATLRGLGLLEEQKRGLPAKLYYRLNVTALLAAIRALADKDGGKRQTRMAENAILECTKTPDKDGGNAQACVTENARQGGRKTPDKNGEKRHAITENTTKTTQRVHKEYNNVAALRNDPKTEAFVVIDLVDTKNTRLADNAAPTIGSVAFALDTAPPIPVKPPLRLSEPLRGELKERGVPVPPPEIVAAAAKLGARIGGGEESAAIQALMDAGVKPIETARRIADKRSERLVLDWCKAIKGGHVDTSRSGPGGVLVAALGGDDAWDLPQAYLEAQRDARNRAAQKAEDARRAQMCAHNAEQARETRQALETKWESMAAQERARIEDQARQEIEKRAMGKRQLAGAGGTVMLRERCLELVKVRMLSSVGVVGYDNTFQVVQE